MNRLCKYVSVCNAIQWCREQSTKALENTGWKFQNRVRDVKGSPGEHSQ